VAKLLGVQDGTPIQAAAGDSLATFQQRVQSPLGFLIVSGILVGSWIVGREIGRSAREGTSLLQATERKTPPTDGEEWISAVAGYAAMGLMGKTMLSLAEEYGWEKVLTYGGGYLVFAAAAKKYKES
jgi:hypothetical protein